MRSRKNVYILVNLLKGFRANSAEMDMVDELRGSNRIRGLQAYIDSDNKDPHNLLQQYCRKNRIALKVSSLDEAEMEITENSEENYAVLTKKRKEELSEFIDKLKRDGTKVQVREKYN